MIPNLHPAASAAAPPGPDRRAHRDWLLPFAPLPPGGLAVDLGCGRGGDLLALAARHPDPHARFLGLDGSDAGVAGARAAAACDARVRFDVATLGTRLPFDDASVDLVLSQNLLECLGGHDTFAGEVARLLRPGGVAVIAHWDFDSQLFDGGDRALVRRLVHAYADMRQPWMAHHDGWMGRRLHGVFAPARSFDGEVHARVLTNTVYAAPWYGHAMARSFGSLVKRGLATAEEYARFVSDLERLADAGRYFYAITGFAWVGRRRDDGREPAREPARETAREPAPPVA